MVTQVLQLIVQTSGTGAAAQQMQNIERSAASAARSVSTLRETMGLMRNVLVGLAFARAFEWVASGVNQMQQINNMLTQVTRNTKEQGLAFNMLARAATAVRAPLDDFTKMVVAIQRSPASFKESTQDIIKATQTMFATFTLSGLDTTAVHNVAKDMKEVFNLGMVQGRQFRAIVVQDQQEALILSKYIHATGVNAAAANRELENIRNKGMVPSIYKTVADEPNMKRAFTGQDILRANIAASDEVMKRFNGTTVTLSQAMVILNNRWLAFLNNANASTGIMSTLSNLVVTISDHIPQILLAVGALAGLMAFNVVAAAISNVGAVFGVVWRMMSAGIGSLVGIIRGALALIGGVAAAFGGLGTAVIVLGGILAAALWQPLEKGFHAFHDYVQQSGGWLQVLINGFAAVGATAQTLFDLLRTGFNVVTTWLTSHFQPAIDEMKKLLEMVFGAAQGVGKEVFTMIPDNIKNNVAGIWRKHYEEDRAGIGNVVGTVQGWASMLGGNVNLVGTPGAPDTSAPVKDLSGKMASALNALAGVLAKFDGPLAKFAHDQDEAKKAIAGAVKYLGESKTAAIFAAAGFKDFNTHTNTSVQLMKDMERSALGMKDTTRDAAEEQTLLNRAIKDGAINLGDYADWVEVVDRKLKDIKATNPSIAGGLQMAGLTIAKTLADQAAPAQAEAMKIAGPGLALNSFQIGMQTLNDIFPEGQRNVQSYTDAVRDLREELLKTKTDALSGFQQGLLEVQKTTEDTAKDTAKFVTDAFSDIQTGLENAILGVKTNFRQMETGLLKDLLGGAIKTVVTGPLSQFLGGFGLGGVGKLGSSPSNPMFVAITGSTPAGALNLANNPLFNPAATASGGFGGPLGGLLGGGTALTTGGLAGSGATSGGGYGGGGSGAGGPVGIFGSGSMYGPLGALMSQGGLFGQGGFIANLMNGTGGAGSSSSWVLNQLGLSNWGGIPNAVPANGGLGGALSSAGDWIGAQASSAGDWISSLFAALPGFATGGEFTVGGLGGHDSQLVRFRATPGETVSIKRPGQAAQAVGGDTHVHVNLNSAEAVDSFKRSSSQVSSAAIRVAGRVAQRNGGG